MIRSVLTGTAFVALSALAATAHDYRADHAIPVTETEVKTDNRAQIADTGAMHQGREYMANGVLVIEGAPRWTEMRQASTTRTLSRVLDPLIQFFD